MQCAGDVSNATLLSGSILHTCARYCSSHMRRMTGWGQFFGDHHVCDEHLRSFALYTNDKSCSGCGAFYTKRYCHWRQEGLEHCWKFVYLQCVLWKSDPVFLYWVNCVVRNGRSIIIKIEIGDERKHSDQRARSVSHRTVHVILVADSFHSM